MVERAAFERLFGEAGVLLRWRSGAGRRKDGGELPRPGAKGIPPRRASWRLPVWRLEHLGWLLRLLHDGLSPGCRCLRNARSGAGSISRRLCRWLRRWLWRWWHWKSSKRVGCLHQPSDGLAIGRSLVNKRESKADTKRRSPSALASANDAFGVVDWLAWLQTGFGVGGRQWLMTDAHPPGPCGE